MAKRKSAAYMTAGEQIAGVVFFVIYLLVLPLVTGPLFRLAGQLLGTTIRPALQNLIYYYVLFVAAVLIFHGFLGRTCRHLVENFVGTARYLGAGLVAFYGLNELLYRLFQLLFHMGVNLNGETISAQVADAPKTTWLILILLGPFVEEVLFRGLVFGNLRRKSAALGYTVSALLFALSHAWAFFLVQQDLSALVLLIEYLAPGLVLAWVYDKTGTLWTPIALHAAANALAVLT